MHHTNSIQMCLKARSNGSNILMQHHPTLLNPTFCTRLATMLHGSMAFSIIFIFMIHSHHLTVTVVSSIINSLAILLKYSFSPLRLQCLVFSLFVALSCSSSNISSRARAAKHLFTVDRSRAIFRGQTNMARFCFLRFQGRFWTQASRAQVLNPICCIRLATSSNNVQDRPIMLDSTTFLQLFF